MTPPGLVQTIGVKGSPRGLTVRQLHDGLWRITRPAGDVLGYVEEFVASDGARFRAKRFLPLQHRFRGEGEFWSMDDAIACFR